MSCGNGASTAEEGGHGSEKKSNKMASQATPAHRRRRRMHNTPPGTNSPHRSTKWPKVSPPPAARLFPLTTPRRPVTRAPRNKHPRPTAVPFAARAPAHVCGSMSAHFPCGCPPLDTVSITLLGRARPLPRRAAASFLSGTTKSATHSSPPSSPSVLPHLLPRHSVQYYTPPRPPPPPLGAQDSPNTAGRVQFCTAPEFQQPRFEHAAGCTLMHVSTPSSKWQAGIRPR